MEYSGNGNREATATTTTTATATTTTVTHQLLQHETNRQRRDRHVDDATIGNKTSTAIIDNYCLENSNEKKRERNGMPTILAPAACVETTSTGTELLRTSIHSAIVLKWCGFHKYFCTIFVIRCGTSTRIGTVLLRTSIVW
mmetsp:Transcript_11480/g.24226  ORF Transcript_11480/g.24226 Transcript_11480/m.24226 type:complete len:141 (+) Transcript_11480:804-1226(+)